MTRDGDNPEPAPGDGWAVRHPEVFGDRGDLPRLRDLWQSAPPPEPGPEVWAAVLSRIEAGLPPGRPPVRRPRWPWWGAFGVSAAAVLAAGLFARSWWPGATPTPTTEAPEEPYPVVEAHEVNIISMAARDTAALVVGEPPVAGDFVFASPQDIRVIKVEPHPASGKVPQLRGEGDVPMFVPVALADGPEDN